MSELFRTTDEHEYLRESVRALADAKIAPRAAEIDETAEFRCDESLVDIPAELSFLVDLRGPRRNFGGGQGAD